MGTFCKIIAVEPAKDKNKRDFNRVILATNATKEVADPETGEIVVVKSRPKVCSVNSYKETYLDNKPHWMYNLSLGDKVYGSIESRKVAPYAIGERTVDSYTCFVESTSDDADFDLVVANAFKNAGHALV